MDDLWSVIAELGLDLHPDRIATIAAKVETLGSANQFALVKSSFGPNVDKDMVARLDRAWKLSIETSPRDVACALRGASATASLLEQRGAIELVWTGPSSGLVPVRHTEQVLCEVIESAKRRLFLVSFVAYEVESITRALRAAIGRHVHIDVLLESSSEHGGKVGYDSVECMRRLLPSVNLYTWQAVKSANTTLLTGAVHAKCVVADGELDIMADS